MIGSVNMKFADNTPLPIIPSTTLEQKLNFQPNPKMYVIVAVYHIKHLFCTTCLIVDTMFSDTFFSVKHFLRLISFFSDGLCSDGLKSRRGFSQRLLRKLWQ